MNVPNPLPQWVTLVCPQCGRHFRLPGHEYYLWLVPARMRNFGLRIICGWCGNDEIRRLAKKKRS